MLTLYNTLTHKKEPFTPIEEGKIRMYVCGPTVYNYIHIGNLRSAVSFDVIRRYLEFRGYEVNYISNFTDVDDKIIKRANEEGITSREVAEKYIKAYYHDADALMVKRATYNPTVVENMDAIIDFVQTLIDKGYAYESNGDVYYRVRVFKDYGKLSAQSIDELREGASDRLAEDQQEQKEDKLDFAVWKKAKENEPSWTSPWGEGRPGWHIECSVMSTKYLGDTIDIHGGGQDLIFPHHENEIAQSEAKTGQTFSRYWMHNGFVTIGEDDEKMSKSLGNFILAKDLIEQEDTKVLRFVLASAHYRNPLRWNTGNIDDARQKVSHLQHTFQNLSYRLQNPDQESGDEKDWKERLEKVKASFIEAMDDDINSPNGLTVIYDFMSDINKYLDSNHTTKESLTAIKALYVRLLEIFGLSFEENESLDDQIQARIEERQKAREAKDFEKSDAIRDQLKDMGIVIEDTKQGTRWSRQDD